MTTISQDCLSRLQNILEYPKNKREELLSSILNAMPAEQFHKVVNEHLCSVTPQVVREYGLECFNKLDTRPNPKDGYISIDEIAEFIEKTRSSKEQALLLYIWLNFEHIRQSSDDFQGEEKPFDVFLTKQDFQNFS